MKILLVEAELKSMTRVKDGSVNLGFNTQAEVPNDEFKLYDQYWHQNGWLAFQLDEFKGDEIPETNTKVQGKVSPSTYLRTRLFAKHMAAGGTKETFPPYYERAIYGFAEAVDDSNPRNK